MEFRVKEVQLYIGAYVVCFVCMYIVYTYVCTYMYICKCIKRFCMHHAHVLIILLSNANTQIFLAYGSPLLIKNTLGKTPCVLASDSGQFVIVKLLEPKMVYVVSVVCECVEYCVCCV